MNVSEMVADSLKFPFSNVKRLLTLGILMATSILIIPAILAYGYNLRIIEYSFKDSNELPPFNEWLNMFVDGLKYIVVIIIYRGIPAIIVGIISAIIIMFIAFSGQVTSFNAFLTTSFQIIFVVGFIIMVVPYILSFIALPHIVKKDKLEASVKFKDILGIIKNIGWVNYIIAVVVLTAFSAVVSALSAIPQLMDMGIITVYAVAAVVGFFLGSYISAFSGRFLALIYNAGIEEVE